MSSQIKLAFEELEADIKTQLPGVKVFWDSNDFKIGIRLTLEFLGYTKGILSFYLKILGRDCYTNNSFIEIAELEKSVLENLPFREGLAQKNPKKLVTCKYHIIIQDDIADREKKETINYTRRFLLICEIGKV